MLLKSKLIVTLTALSLTVAAPAHALGKNERNVLKGVAAALIVGVIVNEGRKANAAQAQTSRHQTAPGPIYQQPAYQPPAHHPRAQPKRGRYIEQTYVEPTYIEPRRTKPGRVIGTQSNYGSGVNDTNAARVFNSYSHAERVQIQRQLARFGYYTGGLDGAFGPRTHQAVYEFARYAGQQNALNTRSGAFQVYEALLG